MTEKQLIHKIQELRAIQPRKDWVVLTKSRLMILAEEPEAEEEMGFSSFLAPFQYKLALAPIISVLIIIGIFGFAQNTVPGDPLFLLKKVTETTQVNFSSQALRPKVHLMLANKRLEELSRIAETNQVKNLAPAIAEFQASVSAATENIAKMDDNVTTSDPLILKDIVAETQKLEENKQKVEAVLGTMIGETDELKNALRELERQIAAYLLEDLGKRTLLEEDQKMLDEAKKDFEEGNYSEALEKILLLPKK